MAASVVVRVYPRFVLRGLALFDAALGRVENWPVPLGFGIGLAESASTTEEAMF